MTRNDNAMLIPESASRAADDAEVTRVESNDDQVRCRAYEIYLDRCRGGGVRDALADWCAAERDLRTRNDGGRETVDIGGESHRRKR